MLRLTIENLGPRGSGVDWLISLPSLPLMDESKAYNKLSSLRGVSSKRDVTNTDITAIDVEMVKLRTAYVS